MADGNNTNNKDTSNILKPSDRLAIDSDSTRLGEWTNSGCFEVRIHGMAPLGPGQLAAMESDANARHWSEEIYLFFGGHKSSWSNFDVKDPSISKSIYDLIWYVQLNMYTLLRIFTHTCRYAYTTCCKHICILLHWVYMRATNLARRTCLRFYSINGDLFHEVEVPMSRGPRNETSIRLPIDIYHIVGCLWFMKDLGVWMNGFLDVHAAHAARDELSHRSLPQPYALGSCSTTTSHVSHWTAGFFGLSSALALIWFLEEDGTFCIVTKLTHSFKSWFFEYFSQQKSSNDWPQIPQNVSILITSGLHTKVRDMLEYVPWKTEGNGGNTRDETTKRVVSRLCESRRCSCWKRNALMKPFVWPTALAMELKDWVTSFASSDLAKFRCQPFAGCS